MKNEKLEKKSEIKNETKWNEDIKRHKKYNLFNLYHISK